MKKYFRKGQLMVKVYENKNSMGKAAAEKAAKILVDAIKEKGEANFIAATGASQFEFLHNLTSISSIDWSKLSMFHLDEYVGLPETHPASFRRYLKERLINKVHPGNVYLIKGDAENPELECERLGKIIIQKKIDLAFVGIGENGHLAFNDPPADFDTNKSYLVVELDDSCRKQQLNEGWFENIDLVPKKAISMSINQIMKSENIICTVPDNRKAQAVKNCFEEEISPLYPASILRKHPQVYFYLDKNSDSLINK
ncbi:MAG TPA: glucosamine-6-phosphate deaminase [Candidatus Atribacteria bacterium]|nr:glucosamine-6-phosphate deaminase [Candidatus Atribacteria bacterium]